MRAAVLLPLLILAGCDSARLDRLEEENADLRAKVAKDKTARDFDLQAKCSKDARAWFNLNWKRDKDTILLDFSNHYNVRSNSCFILVEHHFNYQFGPRKGSAWVNDMILKDVYENTKYGEFLENHITNFEPTLHVTEEVITCDVQGTTCKTGNDFNNLVRPYMTN